MEYGEFNSINISLVEYERTTKRVPTMKSIGGDKQENKASKSNTTVNQGFADLKTVWYDKSTTK